MRRIPSFHALRAFESAARLGGFTRACEELHLTPSAISHQVRALERHFGKALFLRGDGPTRLTPDGERLLAGLSRGFDAIETACLDLDPPAPARPLAVHCTPSFAAKWLGPRLPGFLARHPSIGIRLSSGAETPDLHRHDEVDLAVAYGAAPLRPGVTAEPLGEEEITALCTPDLAARIPPPGAAEIERVVLLESTVSPVRWPDWLAANGVTLPGSRPGPSFDRGSLVVSAAVQGLGIALESLRFAEEEMASGRLVRFGGDRFRPIRRDLHFLCFRTAQRHAPRIRAFRDWIFGEVPVR